MCSQPAVHSCFLLWLPQARMICFIRGEQCLLPTGSSGGPREADRCWRWSWTQPAYSFWVCRWVGLWTTSQLGLSATRAPACSRPLQGDAQELCSFVGYGQRQAHHSPPPLHPGPHLLCDGHEQGCGPVAAPARLLVGS